MRSYVKGALPGPARVITSSYRTRRSKTIAFSADGYLCCPKSNVERGIRGGNRNAALRLPGGQPWAANWLRLPCSACCFMVILYLEFSPAMFNLLMRFLSFSLFEANRSPHVLPHMPWPPNPAIVMISQGAQSIESTTARSGLSRPETKLCPYITKKSLSPARPPLSLLCAQTVDKLAKNGSLVVGRRRFNPVTDRPHCSILRCTKCKRCEIHNVLNFVHESVCLRNG